MRNVFIMQSASFCGLGVEERARVTDYLTGAWLENSRLVDYVSGRV